jgi:hypothetical protein
MRRPHVGFAERTFAPAALSPTVSARTASSAMDPDAARLLPYLSIPEMRTPAIVDRRATSA